MAVVGEGDSDGVGRGVLLHVEQAFGDGAAQQGRAFGVQLRGGSDGDEGGGDAGALFEAAERLGEVGGEAVAGVSAVGVGGPVAVQAGDGGAQGGGGVAEFAFEAVQAVGEFGVLGGVGAQVADGASEAEQHGADAVVQFGGDPAAFAGDGRVGEGGGSVGDVDGEGGEVGEPGQAVDRAVADLSAAAGGAVEDASGGAGADREADHAGDGFAADLRVEVVGDPAGTVVVADHDGAADGHHPPAEAESERDPQVVQGFVARPRPGPQHQVGALHQPAEAQFEAVLGADPFGDGAERATGVQQAGPVGTLAVDPVQFGERGQHRGLPLVSATAVHARQRTRSSHRALPLPCGRHPPAASRPPHRPPPAARPTANPCPPHRRPRPVPPPVPPRTPDRPTADCAPSHR